MVRKERGEVCVQRMGVEGQRLFGKPRSEWARSVLGGNESDRNLERRWTKERTQLVTRLTLGVCWVRLQAAVELLEVKKNYLKHKGSKRGERSRIEELIIEHTPFKEVSEK